MARNRGIGPRRQATSTHADARSEHPQASSLTSSRTTTENTPPEDAFDVDWAQLSRQLPQIIWVTRPDGYHIYFNQQWMDFTGRTLEESLGDGWNPAFHPDDRDRATQRWNDATSSGEPYEIEYRLRRYDGVYRWMLGRAMPLRSSAGEIVRWFGTCTDIEDLKTAQVELERSQTLQQLAGSMARLGAWAIDPSADTVQWSAEIADILEFAPDHEPRLAEAIARYVDGDRQRVEAAIAACSAQGTPFDLQAQIDTFEGRRIWVRAIGLPVHDASGRIVELTGALQDISEYKAAQQRAVELSTQLSETFQSITDPLFTLDRQLRLTYLNEPAATMFQKASSELVTTPLFELWPDNDHAELADACDAVLREGVDRQLAGMDLRVAGITADVHLYPSATGLTVTIKDITEQRENQRQLRERIKELRASAEINAAAHRLDDAGALAEVTANVLHGAMTDPATTLIEVELEDARATAGALSEPARTVTQPIQRDDTVYGRIIVSCASDGVLPEERELLSGISITLALWMGRQRTALELEQANQVKDDLLSMASHELRTPLTPILGFAETIRDRGDLSSSQTSELGAVIHRNARRMVYLVDDLLALNRADAGMLTNRPAMVGVGDVVATVLDELRDSLLVDEVRTDVDGEFAFVDPNHLAQILINLLTNAAKYGEPPVHVDVVSRNDETVSVTVRDHGPGIDGDLQTTMWQRFVQKDRGSTRTARGAGLGLAIVKLLSEVNGGHVRYEPARPGARFVIELPATNQGS